MCCNDKLIVGQLWRRVVLLITGHSKMVSVELQVGALGLRGDVLRGGRGGRGWRLRGVFKRAVFGRGEEELLGHFLLRLSLLVEAQLLQQLIDLRAGHIRQGYPLRKGRKDRLNSSYEC